MRVELKQWLRSHWGEMGDDERAKFPEADSVPEPRGRWHHQHARGL